MTARPHVVILGAGPAGLGAAYRLRHLDKARVTVLEQQAVPGGNAGSFELGGLRVDFGSHRLHPACNAEILGDIRRFLGADLLDRPRHGRIRLLGRWIHFPLKPVDLLLRLDPSFALGSLKDVAAKPFRAAAPAANTFADVLEANLGATICRHFYFPYARKIWGLEPDQLSGIQARRRVSAGSFTKLVRKVLTQLPGLRSGGAGRFYYPRRGFGQISEAYAEASLAAGAELHFGHRVTGAAPPAGSGKPWLLEATGPQGAERLEADYIWSTVPITILSRILTTTPDEVREAGAAIDYRAMVLVYLLLPVDRFTEYDAHYFPGADVSITRLSEPKNYANRSDPPGLTVLCAELPCSPEQPWWTMSEEALGGIVAEDLARSGLPLPAAPVAVHARRLRQAYPIYTLGYERWFTRLDAWVDSLPNLLSYGRQGLFAHDNTHHALAMAYAAAACLGPAGFDRRQWAEHRTVFETHVVED